MLRDARAAGEPIWATGISSEEAVAPVGLALGPDGSVYVTGYFVKSISVGTQTVTGGEQDAYVVALSPQGALRWMHTLKGQGRNGGDGVAVDANSVYVAGSFSTSVTFAGAAHASQGGEDGFIASYGLDGSERSFHDYGANGDDDLRSLTIEGRELHATGTTHGSRKIVTDDRLPGVPITELGPMDYVALGLSLDGKEVWRHDFGRDWATSIAVDPDGVAYIAGRVGTQAVLAQLPHR